MESSFCRTNKNIKCGLDRSRYFENGKLMDPRFSRKYLVAEYRSGYILRAEQIKVIENMVKNPSDWYELRMGLGKTSMIFPIVLKLLAEEGMLPVGLIKDELLTKNYNELDSFTRGMLEQAGAKFQFEITDSFAPSILAERYYRLLKVKEDVGCIVMNIHSQAALEHKLGMLNIDLENMYYKLLGTKN
jgi:hypothetical protein